MRQTGVEGSVLAQVTFKDIRQRQDCQKGFDNSARAVCASVIYYDQLPAGCGRLYTGEIVQNVRQGPASVSRRYEDSKHRLSSTLLPQSHAGAEVHGWKSGLRKESSVSSTALPLFLHFF
jgi:hypothetical protein